MSDTQTFRADALLLLVTLLAAAGWIFSKEALAGMSPLLFIGVRFTLASTILCIASGNRWRRLSVDGFRAATGVGILFALSMMLWIMGLHHAHHVGEGAFITSLGTVMVPIVALAIYRDQQPRTMWLAIPIAVLGFFCLSLNNGLDKVFQLELGQLYFLSAAIIFAFHMNANSRAVQHVPALILTAIQLMFVGVAALLVSSLLEPMPTSLPPVPIVGWLLASAIIATSLRFLIQTYALGLAPVSHAAMILTLEPVWTALLAVLWLGESMNGLQLVGCSLIFAALLINRWQWILALFQRTKAVSR